MLLEVVAVDDDDFEILEEDEDVRELVIVRVEVPVVVDVFELVEVLEFVVVAVLVLVVVEVLVDEEVDVLVRVPVELLVSQLDALDVLETLLLLVEL